MSKLGARPVGHAEEADHVDPTAPAAPVIPIQPTAPAPDWPPASARRISSTAAGSLPPPGRTITLTADRDEDDEPDPKTPTDDDVQDEEDDVDATAPAAPPVPAGPVAKVPPGAKPVRTWSRPWAKAKTGKDDPAPRIALFNLTAAAVGYGLNLAGVVDAYLVGAEQAARGVFEFVLAIGAAVGTWWVTGRPAVREVLSCVPYWPLIRLGACLGLAELGRRNAPLPVAWLNENGQEWGLGPDAVSLLITSGGIAFALWWFIDRKLRRFHWTVRWVARVPLATTVVASLRYGNPI
jgi:hypothetical protein